MKTKVFLGLMSLLAIQFTSFTPLNAQNDEGFIYGEVVSVDGKSYTGQIRWGKEEAYWADHFNSTKSGNDNIKYLSNEELESRRRDRNNKSWLEEMIEDVVETHSDQGISNHLFVCRFGDIKLLEVKGSNRAKLTMKNGKTIFLKGGSNDFGTTLRVLDNELGLIKINWDRIDEVRFMDSPKKQEIIMGEPLYGTVQTNHLDYTGYIQWDHDERLGSDKLDGDTEDGDLSLSFNKINSISKANNGALVVLQSGREINMRGSNDVNSGNRGIIVNIPGMGRVDIPWEEFRKVSFEQNHPNSGSPYADYDNPSMLRGTVTTINGKTISGKIIYDLDEAWDFEILQGEDNDIEYLIPFKYIKRITPRNYSYSRIDLKNGERLTLGKSQDVSDRNDGILVFTNAEDPTYFAWEKIESIEFK